MHGRLHSGCRKITASDQRIIPSLVLVVGNDQSSYCASEQVCSSCNCTSMKQYNLAHRNGIEGLELQTDVPIPPLRSPKDVCA
jgi:hypothetical protein